MIYLVGMPAIAGMAYLTEGDGDPPRTHMRSSAREFKSAAAAERAIKKALRETSPLRKRNYEILCEID